jgi:outer membrane immunogenic protein
MKNSKLTLSAAFAISAILGIEAASAADLPVKALSYTAAVPAFSWTGCYLGGNGGWAWGRSNVNTTFTAPFDINSRFVNELTRELSPALRPEGVTVGGQFGCNRQFGHLVVGGEADFNYFGLKNNISTTFPAAIVNPATQSVTTNSSIETRWLFTARGRLGYAWDTWLLYGTGGLAMTRIDASAKYTNMVVNPPLLVESEFANASTTKIGWTIGAGVEHAISKNWTAKLEYLYADFGSVTALSQIVSAEAGPSGILSNHNFPLRTNIVRFGLNYLFNSGPVVAKY